MRISKPKKVYGIIFEGGDITEVQGFVPTFDRVDTNGIVYLTIGISVLDMHKLWEELPLTDHNAPKEDPNAVG